MKFPPVFSIDIDHRAERLYHVSPNVFDFPDYDAIAPHVIKHDKSANGVLGLWISPYPDMCAAFGPYVYDVVLKEDARCSELELNDLYKMHLYHHDNDWSMECKIAYYQEYRNELLKKTDVLFISDATGGMGEIIVINFDAFESFTKSDYVLK